MELLQVFKTPAARVPRPMVGEAKIADLPDPALAIIPLEYPERLLFQALVQVGETVARNQVIGRSEQENCLHAPISGTVEEVRRIWTASGHHVPALVIRAGEGPVLTGDHELTCRGLDPDRATRVELLKAGGVISPWTTPGLHEAETGTDGLPDIRQVVVLGHDVEPTQQFQELLLTERAPTLLQGMKLLRDVAADPRIILTVSRRRAAWARETFGDGLTVHVVPDDYSRRLPRVLVPRITGVDVPVNAPYRSRGLGVMTVEAALAAQDALEGRPFVRKTLTVSGGALPRPRTVRVALGTRIGTILAACGLDLPVGGRLVAGGPMRGRALYTEDTPLDKFVDGLHVLTADELPAEVNRNCVNCGRCARACPVNIQVHMVGRCVQFDQLEATREYHPEVCLDCGLCTYVCPARRPLVQLVNIAKSYLRSNS